MTPGIDVDFPLEKIAELCRKYQVKELALFGSVARAEARSDSDVDVLVEFLPNARIGFEYAALQRELAVLMGRPVDLASKRALKSRVRETILREARVLYASG